MPAVAHDADLVQPVAVDALVLGVDVNQVRAELAQGPRAVDELPDQVRRVEVQPEPAAGEHGEKFAPHVRAHGHVLAARPLVVGEDHRAVLDADPHVGLLGGPQDRRPDRFHQRHVGIDRQRRVAADEGVDDVDADLRRGFDHLDEVVGDQFAVRGVGVERVRVVPERRDADAVDADELVDVRGGRRGEVRHVEVRDPGVPPLRFPRRPAH